MSVRYPKIGLSFSVIVAPILWLVIALTQKSEIPFPFEMPFVSTGVTSTFSKSASYISLALSSKAAIKAGSGSDRPWTIATLCL